jgi:hypothetical protein
MYLFCTYKHAKANGWNVWKYRESTRNRDVCCDVFASNVFHTRDAVSAKVGGHLAFKEEASANLERGM